MKRVLLRPLLALAIAAPALAPTANAAPPAAAPRPHARTHVIVYGTNWCPGCKNARAFFAERKDVEWVYVDIEKSPENRAAYDDAIHRARMQGVPADGYPIIEIATAQGPRFYVGFDAGEMRRALGKKG